MKTMTTSSYIRLFSIAAPIIIGQAFKVNLAETLLIAFYVFFVAMATT